MKVFVVIRSVCHDGSMLDDWVDRIFSNRRSALERANVILNLPDEENNGKILNNTADIFEYEVID